MLLAASVPPEHLQNIYWRPEAPAYRQGCPAPRLLLVGNAVHATGIYQAETRKLVEVGDAEVGMAVPQAAVLSVAPIIHGASVRYGRLTVRTPSGVEEPGRLIWWFCLRGLLRPPRVA